MDGDSLHTAEEDRLYHLRYMEYMLEHMPATKVAPVAPIQDSHHHCGCSILHATIKSTIARAVLGKPITDTECQEICRFLDITTTPKDIHVSSGEGQVGKRVPQSGQPSSA